MLNSTHAIELNIPNQNVKICDSSPGKNILFMVCTVT